MKAFAILLGAMLMTTTAYSDVIATRCVKADCARLRCDEWGENCSRSGLLKRVHGSYAAPASHQVCNEFGDCHFVRPEFPLAPKSAAAKNPPSHNLN